MTSLQSPQGADKRTTGTSGRRIVRLGGKKIKTDNIWRLAAISSASQSLILADDIFLDDVIMNKMLLLKILAKGGM